MPPPNNNKTKKNANRVAALAKAAANKAAANKAKRNAKKTAKNKNGASSGAAAYAAAAAKKAAANKAAANKAAPAPAPAPLSYKEKIAMKSAEKHLRSIQKNPPKPGLSNANRKHELRAAALEKEFENGVKSGFKHLE
jgi:hypothetical protein